MHEAITSQTLGFLTHRSAQQCGNRTLDPLPEFFTLQAQRQIKRLVQFKRVFIFFQPLC